eukprot:TRINITY_DN24347_c0_g1_i1.p1 TRINITY_DN24347_c0_g1~~TRINITY_DN24347_c0_g1_i1.p1  ORF type:complete len:467 (-),score=64.41 TRINITY_DN24347_c0_g1_i1:596-1996(-)
MAAAFGACPEVMEQALRCSTPSCNATMSNESASRVSCLGRGPGDDAHGKKSRRQITSRQVAQAYYGPNGKETSMKGPSQVIGPRSFTPRGLGGQGLGLADASFSARISSLPFCKQKSGLQRRSAIECQVADQQGSVQLENEIATQSNGAADAQGMNGFAMEQDREDDQSSVLYSSITEWELDFCSRPILDERGKRIWELLICDSSLTLQHAEYFPSNKINSATLKAALVDMMERQGVPKPQKIRFFRGQMQSIISKACAELDIRAVPSQRCVALVQWLDERALSVYPNTAGFLGGGAVTPPGLLQVEVGSPQNLPDNLQGEQWAFVQLPLGGVIEEMERVQRGDAFGAILDLESMGLLSLSSDTMVPGVAVSSSRATPLAAWTSALELASLRADAQRACLVLHTGVSDRWRYAFYRRSKPADEEAAAWEAAKARCAGLHFLAVQSNLEAEDCAGFWLMRDLPLPQL